MDLGLTGKRALVTGSSAGIGAGIATTLASEGAFVLVHGTSADRAQHVADSIVAAGYQATAVAADLTDDEAVADLVHSIDDGVDVLVNNAGIYRNSTWSSARGEDWLTVYDANVVSAVRLIRALVPSMRERRFGRVIQIASGESTQPFSFMPDYAVSKAALVNLTVSLARELAGSGVTANTVSPGIVVTAGVEAFYRDEAPKRGWGENWNMIEAGVIRDVLPNAVGRLGRVEDVADLVAFLASPRSGYITGANLRVDGGAVMCVN